MCLTTVLGDVNWARVQRRLPTQSSCAPLCTRCNEVPKAIESPPVMGELPEQHVREVPFEADEPE